MTSSEPRRRGRPPLIDRARIVAAARTIPAQKLTMQIVADALGVDRKALNYHVSDREGLLQLVAADKFAEAMTKIEVVHAGEWQQSVQVYADGVRAAVLHLGALAPHLRLQSATVGATLGPVDDLIDVLLRTGFPRRTVARSLRMVSSLATASGRESLLLAAGDVTRDPAAGRTRDQAALLRQVAGDFPGLRQLAETEDPAADTGQWQFELAVCIAGMEQQLTTGDSPAT